MHCGEKQWFNRISLDWPRSQMTSGTEKKRGTVRLLMQVERSGWRPRKGQCSMEGGAIDLSWCQNTVLVVLLLLSTPGIGSFVGSFVRACVCSVGRLFVRSVVCSGWVLKAPRHKSSPKGPPKLLVCQYFCTTHKIHETLAPPVPHLWNQYSDFPVNFATTQILTVNKVDTMNS